jgi:hypothetical protein
MFSLLKNELRTITRADWDLANYEAQRSPLQRKDMEGFVARTSINKFSPNRLTELKFENGETVEVLISQLVAFCIAMPKGISKKRWTLLT